MISLALSLLVLAPPANDIDYAKAWDQTAGAIQRAYYARSSRKAEMEKRLKEYGPIASKATTKSEFRDTVEKMIGEFKDSHFDIYTDEDQGYYLMDALGTRTASDMPEIGAWFKKVGDTYTVQMLLNGSEAEKAGLRKGDVIISTDSKPFTPITSLKGDLEKTAELRVSRANREFTVKVAVHKEPALRMFLDATKESVRVIDTGGKKIGYIHLWTQASDDFRNALSNAVYGKLQKTDAIILDLRDGFGGRPEGYGDPFFRPQIDIGWKFPTGETHQILGYQKPLVVLINGGSRSAKEVLSYIFKQSHRATLIGSNTAGNVLGTSPRRLNDWAYLEIPMVEVFADGVRLEGKGVSPDIALSEEIDANGKDLYVDAATKFLLAKKTARG